MVNRAATDSPVWSWPATDAFLQSKSFSEFIRHEKFLTSISGQPQADWVCDETASCIVDFVGRCEHLEETVKTITMQIGLTAGPLGVQNTSTADHPVGELLQREDDYYFLRNIYRRDFDLFGYDPDLRL